VSGKKNMFKWNPFIEDPDFPIHYKNKEWYEKDCDETFLVFYPGSFALIMGCAVRIDSQTIIYPDGKIEDY